MCKKASDNFKVIRNLNGQTISTLNRKIIEADGLYFKDIDGSGTVSDVNDWRLPAQKRAASYVKLLTPKEKLAQLFISDWRMGKYPIQTADGTYKPKTFDESGILDEGEFTGKTIFGKQKLPGTTTLIKDWFNRHIILRANPTPEDMADFFNQLNAVAEECAHFIPVEAASNSRNENGEVVYGMNDAAGTFATWPGTLGIAAAVKGSNNDLSIIKDFGDCIKREWNACGLRKGYMYMADCVSDPRWQRTFGTFGEDSSLIEQIFDVLIPSIQGSDIGITQDGVAMTVKHFPGGGARENGFDPHYKAGQWNVYKSPESLKKYHMITFRPAIRHGASSIMPYYSKPSKAKSEAQHDFNGELIKFMPYGFAYNKIFTQDILRNQMGFTGYLNSDTGIIHNMSWGVEALDISERIGFAVTQGGIDLISGLFDNDAALEAYNRGKNNWYDNHKIPEGYTKDDLVISDISLDRAVTRTLTELFALGMFDNPYRDPAEAKTTVQNKSDWLKATEIHKKSVVLLKNDGILPLTEKKLKEKKLYVKAFYKDIKKAEQATSALKNMLKDYILTEDYTEADIAILMINPSSGAYFSATPGYLELDICEEKTVVDVDENCCPMSTTHNETTLSEAKLIKEISEAVHTKGGKVISNINFTLAWIPGNVEKYSDALTAGFDTYPSATLDVIFGRFNPQGKLPLTLPRSDKVLSVDKNGICVSPNDVPGYDKDKYIDQKLKDENGKAYAYRDTAGNYYELNFGLTY